MAHISLKRTLNYKPPAKTPKEWALKGLPTDVHPSLCTTKYAIYEIQLIYIESWIYS